MALDNMKHFVEAWKGLGDSEDDLGVSKVSRSIWGILVVSARKSVTIPKPFTISQQRTQLYNRFSRVPSIWWDGGASALSKPPEPLQTENDLGQSVLSRHHYNALHVTHSSC